MVNATHGHQKRRKGRTLNPPLMDGYPVVLLCRNGIERRRRVHQLVLEAFVGPKPPGHETRHKDGNRANNHVQNLAWGTSRENEADKKRHGTYQSGGRASGAKLTEESVLAIRHIRAAGLMTVRQMAIAFGVTEFAIYEIVKNRTWRHLSAQPAPAAGLKSELPAGE